MSKQAVLNYQIPYTPHAGQLMCHKHPARFRVLANGRRWGKTMFLPIEVRQIMIDFCSVLPPAELIRAWVIAPTYDLVMEDWMAASALFGPIIFDRNITEKWMRVYLKDGRIGLLEFKSAERGDEGLRGAGLVAAGFDECSRIQRIAWEQGVRPALAIYRGRALFVSTPCGRNWFHELFLKAQHDPDWMAWTFPSITSPYFPKDEWEKIKLTTPELVFKQEYMAEFVEGSTSVFHRLDQIATQIPPKPFEGDLFSIGVDLARTVDFTVIAVMSSSGQLVDLHRSKELDWSYQRRIIESLWRKYQPGKVVLDASGIGDVVESNLRQEGIAPLIPVKTASTIEKANLIENLSISIEQGLFSIADNQINPDWGWLWEELRAYTSERLDSGHIRYSAPEGLHDDGVIALALAAWGLKGLLGRKKEAQNPRSPYTTWKEYEEIQRTPDARLPWAPGIYARKGISISPI